MTGHGITGVADAGAFLARLNRLDRAAVVRLRPGTGRTALWARLPWGVLVTRTVDGAGPGDDVTVPVGEMLTVLASDATALPTRCDGQWRWPLPPSDVRVVETVTVSELAGLAAAAAGTLRQAAAGALSRSTVGERAVRDALLDHVALRVTPDVGQPVQVSQRLVQAVSRMGFLGPDLAGELAARVCVAGRWVGLSAPFGIAWHQPNAELTVMPISSHPIR